jgi:hypothetical protein
VDSTRSIDEVEVEFEPNRIRTSVLCEHIARRKVWNSVNILSGYDIQKHIVQPPILLR